MSVQIIPIVQQPSKIKAKLNRWKKEFGEDANFLSKDNYPFNCFDEVWTLNGEGENGTQLKFGFSHAKGWDDDVQCHVRRAAAALAKRLAATSVHNSLMYFIRNTPLTEFTQPEIEGTWPLMGDFQRNQLKRLLVELKKVNKAVYEESHKWVQANHVPAKPKFDPYNIETGALSEFELQSFERELALAMKAKVSGLQEDADNDSTQLEKMKQIRGFIALRLLYALVRRPTNLRQLKWNDILPVGASFNTSEAEVARTEMTTLDFSDEDELQVRIWKSKNTSTFRTSVERYSLSLNAKLSIEILQYRQAYRRCLQMRLAALKIQVTEEELDSLMMRAPVLFNGSLFKTEFSDISELFSALSTQASGFHEKSQLIIHWIAGAIAELDLKSDRLSNLKVSNNRIRHTVATIAAMLGYDAHHIANLLGNTMNSARSYIDMNDELRASLDIKYVGNNKLKKMFKADVVTLLKDERYTLMDDMGNEAGQAKSRKACAICDEVKRPLACYGCNNFQALDVGDHRRIRDEGQRLYDKRIADGDPSFVLGKLAFQIKWVDATIAICDERIANRCALNAE